MARECYWARTRRRAHREVCHKMLAVVRGPARAVVPRVARCRDWVLAQQQRGESR